jgi:hypothetical protein
MNVVCLAYIMIGVNHLAHIPGPMIYFMQIICFQSLRKGANVCFVSHTFTNKNLVFQKEKKLFVYLILKQRLWHRCKFEAVVAEVDRILRPEGKLIVRDTAETIKELESLVTSMQWEVRMTYTKDLQGILCVQKSMWRPTELETVEYAIGSIPNSRQ